jgi:hypothetical protein
MLLGKQTQFILGSFQTHEYTLWRSAKLLNVEAGGVFFPMTNVEVDFENYFSRHT